MLYDRFVGGVCGCGGFGCGGGCGLCVCVLKFLKHAIALTTPKVYAYDRFISTSLKGKN